MDRLDRTRIDVAGLEVRVVDRCTSTNALLLVEGKERTERAANSAILLAAEEQSAGRGQRGRKWRSAPGAGATFSILRRMRCAPQLLSGMSLAVGVAAARALHALGATQVALKWPNDLLVNDSKLGGVLIETRLQANRIMAVVGIGINCRPMGDLATRLRRKRIALDDLVQPPVSRNAVIAAVAREVLAALEAFEKSGLPAFADAWRALHVYEGRRLHVRLADGRSLRGVAAGLAPSGALRLQTRAGVRDVASGRIVSAGAA